MYFSTLHWLVVAAFVAAWAVPLGIILRRLGFSWWAALTGIVPIVAMLVIAFARWPIPDASANRYDGRL